MAGKIYAEKEYQTAALQGKVFNNATIDSDVDALSINETKRLIHGDSLLFNGDFQINQRGKNEYSITSSDLFTLDRWRIIGADTTAKLTKLDNGVILQNTGAGSVVLTQRIYIEKVSNYTIVINAKNVVGNVIIEIYDMGSGYQKQNLKIGRNVIKVTNQSIKDISPTIVGAGSIEIEYVDLFEGDIAYPHVKEDYTIALMRCQRYLYVLGNNTAYVNGGIFCVYDSHKVKLFHNFNMLNMRISPSVRVENPSLTLYGVANANNINITNFGVSDGTNTISVSDNDSKVTYQKGTMGLWQLTPNCKIIFDAEIY